MNTKYFGGHMPTPVPFDHPMPHMEEYLENLHALRKSDDYIRVVRTALAHFSNFAEREGLKHPDEIQRHHLLRFQIYVSELTTRLPTRAGQPLALSYQQQLMKYIRTWSHWMLELEYITHNPWRTLKIPGQKKKPKPLEVDEIAQLFEAHLKMAFSTSPFYYHRREVILVLLYGWGLRIHELQALTVTAMDVRQDFITSINKKTRHGDNDTKALPYSNMMKQTVERYLVHRAKRALPHVDALLITRDGNAMSVESIYKIVIELGQRAGVPINPHRFRDSFGTTMLDNDVPVERVMMMMGHTQRAQTLAYSRVNDHRLKASHDKAMEPILEGLLMVPRDAEGNRVEWRRAPDFAEIAETLGIKTTQVVMAQNVRGARVMVIYSPDDKDHERVSSVHLLRDRDNILQLASVPKEIPGFFEELQRKMTEPDEDE